MRNPFAAWPFGRISVTGQGEADRAGRLWTGTRAGDRNPQRSL